MKNQSRYQEVIDEIKQAYADYAKNPIKALDQKEVLINKIRSLPMHWDRKECLGFMLLTCLEALFAGSKSNLSKSEKSTLRLKAISEVQHILKIYPEITSDNKESFSS